VLVGDLQGDAGQPAVLGVPFHRAAAAGDLGDLRAATDVAGVDELRRAVPGIPFWGRVSEQAQAGGRSPAVSHPAIAALVARAPGTVSHCVAVHRDAVAVEDDLPGHVPGLVVVRCLRVGRGACAQRDGRLERVEPEGDRDPVAVVVAQVVRRPRLADVHGHAGREVQPARRGRARQFQVLEILVERDVPGGGGLVIPDPQAASCDAGVGADRGVQPCADSPLRDEEGEPVGLGLVEVARRLVQPVVGRREVVLVHCVPFVNGDDGHRKVRSEVARCARAVHPTPAS
jgi:hypothetical protein